VDIAKQRFWQIERRLQRLPAKKKMFSGFLQEYKYIDLGHMHPVDSFDSSQPHYVIPHHAVLRPDSSTTKLRVVFDASAKSSTGVSLNKHFNGWTDSSAGPHLNAAFI